jgi:adenylyltransferase/sulfurtransferase
MTVEELKRRIDAGDGLMIVDVREPHEARICALPGAVNIPLGVLPESVNRLTGAGEIVVHCKTGARSARAVRFLMDSGFRGVSNLAGGIERWARVIDPSMPRY